MKATAVGGLIGAFAGFVALLLPHLLPIYSHGVQTLLFPGRVLIAAAAGMGMFGHMIFDTFAYLLSVLLYAAVGYGIGWLSMRKGNAG